MNSGSICVLDLHLSLSERIHITQSRLHSTTFRGHLYCAVLLFVQLFLFVIIEIVVGRCLVCPLKRQFFLWRMSHKLQWRPSVSQAVYLDMILELPSVVAQIRVW